MSKYAVTAVVVDLTAEPYTISEPSVATIDTAEPLYADCVTLRDVETRYEGFWNYLNSDDKVHHPPSKVKVLNVVRVEGEAPAYRTNDIRAILTKVRGL